jgi:hypothetical protein
MKNERQFRKMMLDIVNTSSETLWSSDEHKKEFMYISILDYIDFLSALSFVGNTSNSHLNKHFDYLNAMLILNDRYNSIGKEAFRNNPDELLDRLQQYIQHWSKNELNKELRILEKNHYKSLAFSNEENPHQQMAGRTAQLKEQALRNIKNYLG